MLRDLNPKDIYLGKTASWISGVEGKSDPLPAPEDCREELAELRRICEETQLDGARQEFAIRHNGNSYRVSLLQSLSDIVYVLRYMSASVPTLDQLGIHAGYVSHLLKPEITGMIILAGAFGQGKTTTASSIVTTRLARHGGVAVTVEDPPELPLEGIHGAGICYQTWVEQGQFGEACRKIARYAPDIIFIGEIRDPDAAVEALRASINGKLVICTIHADTVIMAIERLYSLANGRAGNSEDTSSLLASGLLCVMHQKLDGKTIKHPKIEFLWAGGHENQGLKNMIRLRRFDQIGSEVTLQLNRMLMGCRSASDPGMLKDGERRRYPREQ